MIKKMLMASLLVSMFASFAGSVTASTIDEYTYFSFTGSREGGGFSYLNDSETGDPYLVRETPSTGIVVENSLLFLQFEGLVGLDALAGETFTFGTSTVDDPRLFHWEWQCLNSPPCYPANYYTEISFDESGLPDSWSLRSRFSDGDYYEDSSSQRTIPQELVDLGLSSSTFYGGVFTQENQGIPDQYFYNKTTWTGFSEYNCAELADTGQYIGEVECSLPDIGEIQPIPEVSAAGSLAAIASLLSLMAFLWERRRVQENLI